MISLSLDEARQQDTRRHLALGFFDGVHRGHQALLGRAVERAQHEGTPAVLTFVDHPLTVLAPSRAPLLLSTKPEKQAQVARLGVKHLILADFTPEFSALSPEAFVREVLVDALQVASVVVGTSYRFGQGAQGTPEMLVHWGQHLGFDVDVVASVEVDGTPVSSTRVREQVAAGKLAEAEFLLGRPYSLLGKVLHGDARGATIGFPTANLAVPMRKQMPPRGVYAVSALMSTGRVLGVANLGVRPTFGGETCQLEVHFLDFSGDLYGQTLEICFHQFVRPEMRFSGVAELQAQIQRDVEAARSSLTHGV